MPMFIAALLGGLIQAAGTLVGRVLISLGFGYVVFQGLDTGLDWVRGQIAASIGALPAQALAVLSAMRAGEGIAILIAALGVRLLLDTLGSASVKKLVLK